MGEAVAERTGKKVERSKGRAGVIQYRRKGWENINKDAEVAELKADERDDEEGGEWETDEEKEAETNGPDATDTAEPAVEPSKDEGYIAVDDDGDEEIL